MSKLSASLKALINAAHAKPGTLRAPENIRSTYSRIAASAKQHNVGLPAWLTLSTAATMTMNSPESLSQLYQFATEAEAGSSSQTGALSPIQKAELMREVGLKCISFNGIPRTINMLGAFHSTLPSDVQSRLSNKPTRELKPNNTSTILDRGRKLWDSIYDPFDQKLVDKLAVSHPNLPVHILSSHYGNLLSDPDKNMPANAGRVLTSIIAVACLRAQTGVGPQVTSHVFGLRKAYAGGSSSEQAEAEGEAEEQVEGGKWLASDEGNQWILNSVDEIVAAIGAGQGSSFAPGMTRDGQRLKAKL